MDKVGNLVRLLEKPEGLEDFSVLEWFLITGNPSADRFEVKRYTGLKFFVEKPNMGKEYDFRTFELESAEELAELLILINLKIDIINSVVPVVNIPNPLSHLGAPSPTTYTIPTTSAPTTLPSYTVTYGTGGTVSYNNAHEHAQAPQQPSLWNQIFGGKP